MQVCVPFLTRRFPLPAGRAQARLQALTFLQAGWVEMACPPHHWLKRVQQLQPAGSLLFVE
jgi:hypothetical protein